MKAGLVKTRHGRVSVHDDDNGRLPVVLLHGLGGDHNQVLSFIPVPERVPPTGVRRIAIDLRGHGDTDDLGDASTLNVRSFSEDVFDVLDEMRPSFEDRPVVLVGISMGAEIALGVTVRRPEIVGALALIRPSWSGEPGGDNATTFSALARYLRTWGAAGEERFVTEPAFHKIAAASPAMGVSIRKQFHRDRAVNRAPVLEYVPRSERVTSLAEMRTITCPTLVLGADDDPVHPLASAKLIASNIVGSTATTLPMKLAERGEHELALQYHLAAFLSRVGTS